MRVEVKGVGYEISDKLREHLDKKLEKLKHAEKVLDSVCITIAQRHNDYILDTDLHFNWGLKDHLKVENFDLYDAIDLMDEKMTTKIRREKEKNRQF